MGTHYPLAVKLCPYFATQLVIPFDSEVKCRFKPPQAGLSCRSGAYALMCKYVKKMSDNANEHDYILTWFVRPRACLLLFVSLIHTFLLK